MMNRPGPLFVVGGARSGKSRYAQQRTEALGNRFAYIATAQALDAEMKDRIARHRSDRGEYWHTMEAPLDLPGAITGGSRLYDALLVDCLTLWLSNLICADSAVERAFQELAEAVNACQCPLILVANEVGLGLVPDNALARRFRDEAGRLNQKIAQIADEVIFIAAGLPLRLK